MPLLKERQLICLQQTTAKVTILIGILPAIPKRQTGIHPANLTFVPTNHVRPKHHAYS